MVKSIAGYHNHIDKVTMLMYINLAILQLSDFCYKGSTRWGTKDLTWSQENQDSYSDVKGRCVTIRSTGISTGGFTLQVCHISPIIHWDIYMCFFFFLDYIKQNYRIYLFWFSLSKVSNLKDFKDLYSFIAMSFMYLSKHRK